MPFLTRTAGLVAKGLTNKQIAWEMGVSEGSARIYVSRAFKELGLKNGSTHNKRVLLTQWVHGNDNENALSFDSYDVIDSPICSP